MLECWTGPLVGPEFFGGWVQHTFMLTGFALLKGQSSEKVFLFSTLKSAHGAAEIETTHGFCRFFCWISSTQFALIPAKKRLV